MLSERTREIVEGYWAERFGCSPEDVRRPGVVVVSHVTDLRGYAGVYAYRRDETCIVSVPDAYVDAAIDDFAARRADNIFNVGALCAFLGDDAGVVVGPASLAYADASTFLPATAAGVRMLGVEDEVRVREFEASCDATEWDHADIEYEREPIFGCFVAGLLAAAASYRMRSATIASIGIITHPAYRRRGLARAAASAATTHALEAGLIAQWQTLEANVPSIAVARALGFEAYCRTIAVRLRPES